MRVALVAGEASGDMLGAGLMRAIGERADGICFEGVAGPDMAAAGCEVLEPAESLAVMGLIEPLKVIPRLWRLRRRLLRRWVADPPDVMVGIDAPDFNLGLEIRLRAAGIPTIHYVSPSVWAWRQRRLKKIGRAADQVLCLLPFEKAFYDRNGIAARFVGHPLADAAPASPDRQAARDALGVTASKIVAVLPGSRMSEVSRLGRPFAAAARRLAGSYPALRFVAPMASGTIRAAFENMLRAEQVDDRFLLVDGDAERVLVSADVVLLASGTAALQAALLGRPMVAAYRLAPLTYAIAKGFGLVKVPYFTLPNLLTDEPLVPEFLQADASPQNLATQLSGLLDDPVRCEEISRRFAVLRNALARDADRQAADAVLAVCGRRG